MATLITRGGRLYVNFRYKGKLRCPQKSGPVPNVSVSGLFKYEDKEKTHGKTKAFYT